MEILLVVWLVFNVVFGLFTGRNLCIKFYAIITNNHFTQSTAGKLIDMAVLVSIISLTVCELQGII